MTTKFNYAKTLTCFDCGGKFQLRFDEYVYAADDGIEVKISGQPYYKCTCGKVLLTVAICESIDKMLATKSN